MHSATSTPLMRPTRFVFVPDIATFSRRGIRRVRTAGAQKRTMTFDDFAAVRAVSDPQPSPDGANSLHRADDGCPANRRTPTTFMIRLRRFARAFPADVPPPRRAGRLTESMSRMSPAGSSGFRMPTGAQATHASRTAARRDRSGRRRTIASRSRRPSIPIARPTRAMRREESGRGQQGEGAHRRPAHVPALDGVGRRHALASVRRG